MNTRGQRGLIPNLRTRKMNLKSKSKVKSRAIHLSLQQAIKNPNSEDWVNAMKTELKAIQDQKYLELRFNRLIRTLGSSVFTIHMIMYMPIVLYAPALALSEVTGLNLWVSVLSIGIVCTFYTSIGGMKAVVWTDLFQTLLMYAAMFVVVFKHRF
ncbi:sodium-dependent multivitamin transporter-like [Centruroides vittatus]|uniref:sodium-dependent multivitamin transporter-like n=1 Tax=Centruroides vittatus TaxID=120091 RepID=UPI00350F7836